MHGDYKTIDEPLIGNAVSKDALLACTTCGACVEQCPSRIEIGGAIMQMRRSIAMEEGHFAPGRYKTLQNISSVGNPWGLDPDKKDSNGPKALTSRLLRKENIMTCSTGLAVLLLMTNAIRRLPKP